MHELRRLLQKAVKPYIEKPVALLFSGGTDSLTIFWTLLDLQTEFTCYTFRLSHIKSTDSQAAKKAADFWNVPIEIIKIPYKEPKELSIDVGQLVNRIGSHRKTHVECLYPMLWMPEAIKEKTVFCGINADLLHGTTRNLSQNFGKSHAAFTRERKRQIGLPDVSGLCHITKLFTENGQRIIYPYRNQDILNYFYSFSWKELNKGKQKIMAVKAFGDYFRQLAIYRRNASYQSNMGMREYMARMLEATAININKCRSMVSLYKDLGRRYAGS